MGDGVVQGQDFEELALGNGEDPSSNGHPHRLAGYQRRTVGPTRPAGIFDDRAEDRENLRDVEPLSAQLMRRAANGLA